MVTIDVCLASKYEDAVLKKVFVVFYWLHRFVMRGLNFDGPDSSVLGSTKLFRDLANHASLAKGDSISASIKHTLFA